VGRWPVDVPPSEQGATTTLLSIHSLHCVTIQARATRRSSWTARRSTRETAWRSGRTFASSCSQTRLPWSLFFHLPSQPLLQVYARVVSASGVELAALPHVAVTFRECLPGTRIFLSFIDIVARRGGGAARLRVPRV
jgi:hypothetical protein